MNKIKQWVFSFLDFMGKYVVQGFLALLIALLGVVTHNIYLILMSISLTTFLMILCLLELKSTIQDLQVRAVVKHFHYRKGTNK